MGKLAEYIREEAAKKKKPPGKWLLGIAKNAPRCILASAVGKFSHPDVQVVVSPPKSEETEDGYVYTAKIRCPADIIVSSAAYLPTPKFLMTELPDGMTVLEHLRDDSNLIREELSAVLESEDAYETLREELLKVREDFVPDATDDRIRQVFFPTDGEGRYHLLSVLPPSSLMMEMKRRIQRVTEHARMARDEKSEKYGEPHARFFNLTRVNFGGAQPQNISMLNAMNGGTSFMLPSMPPLMGRRDIVPPRHDFFRTIRVGRTFFQTLHYFYSLKINNKNIRISTREAEIEIIDMVFLNVYRLRSLPPGWSDVGQLPKSQRIWLDNKYTEERITDDEWIDEVSAYFSRWMMNTYEKVMKAEAVKLGDGEYKELKREVEEILEATREV